MSDYDILPINNVYIVQLSHKYSPPVDEDFGERRSWLLEFRFSKRNVMGTIITRQVGLCAKYELFVNCESDYCCSYNDKDIIHSTFDDALNAMMEVFGVLRDNEMLLGNGYREMRLLIREEFPNDVYF